jgi:hypothetical protein
VLKNDFISDIAQASIAWERSSVKERRSPDNLHTARAGTRASTNSLFLEEALAFGTRIEGTKGRSAIANGE